MKYMENFHRLLFVAIMLVAAGCASQHYNNSASSVRSVSNSAVPERQIIRSAAMSLEVEKPKGSSEIIVALVKAEGGFLEDTRNYTNESVFLRIRIPSKKLDSLLQKISGEGLVTSQSTNSRDVTEEMMDVGARLNNFVKLRARMRKLLDKAEKVTEILDIEKELSRIQTQIDRIEGQRKLLESQVAYSSLDLNLNKKIVYGPLGYLGKGLIEIILKLFIWSE